MKTRRRRKAECYGSLSPYEGLAFLMEHDKVEQYIDMTHTKLRQRIASGSLCGCVFFLDGGNSALVIGF